MSSYVSQTASRARLPQNYLTILETIRGVESGVHLTAHEIFMRVREQRPAIGFATVHRGLTRLFELGYVFRVDIPGAVAAVYEQTASPHAHFRCIACGSISDIEFRVPGEQLLTLAERFGLHIAAQATTFTGTCAKCANTCPA